jgi:hypothetical protein
VDKSLVKKLLDKVKNLDRPCDIRIVWSSDEEDMLQDSYADKDVDLVIVRLYA